MNIIETIICGCIGGLTVVLPYIIYMRIRTRRKPATAIGKPIGDRTGAVMPDKKEDLPPDDLKADLYAELNEEAGKADYIPCSPDKLIIEQFGLSTKPGPGNGTGVFWPYGKNRRAGQI